MSVDREKKYVIPKSYSDSIDVIVSANSNDIFLPKKAIHAFNTIIFRLFLDILATRIEHNYSLGIDAQETIYSFLHELDIVELYSFDSAKKALLRRKKQNQKLPLKSVYESYR